MSHGGWAGSKVRGVPAAGTQRVNDAASFHCTSAHVCPCEYQHDICCCALDADLPICNGRRHCVANFLEFLCWKLCSHVGIGNRNMLSAITQQLLVLCNRS